MDISMEEAIFAAVTALTMVLQLLVRARRDRFDHQLELERERLRHLVRAKHPSPEREEGDGADTPDSTAEQQLPGAEASAKGASEAKAEGEELGGLTPQLTQRIDDDKFAELLIEYYAYGLTQARNSFSTSQRFAGFGASILLIGIAIAVWRAETTGDLYLGIVTSSAGAVTMLIGQLFHRRADIALQHMATQTDGLRDDMRAERSTEQALALLSEVDDPEVKVRLQAGLIMKLASSSMPSLVENLSVSMPRENKETAAATE